MSNELVVDVGVLKSLQELLGDNFALLIETYLTDSQKRIERLHQAYNADDMDEISSEVHGLKGSSRNLGANQIGDLCEVLEKEARQGAIINKEQQLAAIESNFAAVTAQLSVYL